MSTPRAHASGMPAADDLPCVYAISLRWQAVDSFFSDFRLAETQIQRQELIETLPEVGAHLDCIVDLLVRDLHNAPLELLEEADNRTPMRRSTTTFSEEPSPSTARRDETSMMTGEEEDDDSCSGGDQCFRVKLPPSYLYLFTGENVFVPSVVPERSGGAATTGAAVTTGPNEAQPVLPEQLSGVGSTFLFFLCQYAKHDDPPGSRVMILRFMRRLLDEADLPVAQLRALGQLPCSVLQLYPSFTIVPTLDMIRNVDLALRSGAGKKGGGRTMNEDYSAEVEVGFAQMLCALAQRMEVVPDLANFFVSQSGDGPTQQLILLPVLIPFMTLDSPSGGDGPPHRRDACIYALTAIHALAKSPDPWLQTFVGAYHSLRDVVVHGANSTMVTVCTIPDKEYAASQLQYLIALLRWWTAMLHVAPAVSRALGLREALEANVVQESLLPLLQATDVRVYSSACLMVAAILEDLLPAPSVVSDIFIAALLGTVVDTSSGEVVSGEEGKEDYFDLHAPLLRQAMTVHGGVEPTLSQDEKRTSFANYYFRPHLTASPLVTASHKTTPKWAPTQATLILLDRIARSSPYLFMKYTMLLEMATMDVDVLHLPPPMPQKSSGVVAATVLTAPAINVSACFPKKLRTKGAICGMSQTDVGEEVLRRMMEMEATVPTSAMEARMRCTNVFCRPSVDGQASAVSGRPRASTGGKEGNDGSRNLWFHRGVHMSQLIGSLCQLLNALLDLPNPVRLLLTQLCSTLCIMPDMRVLYTLMDPEYGRLEHALQKVQALLEERMEKDSEVAFAAASAAAAASSNPPLTVAPPPKKTSTGGFFNSLFGGSSSSSAPSANAGASVSVRQTSANLALGSSIYPLDTLFHECVRCYYWPIMQKYELPEGSSQSEQSAMQRKMSEELRLVYSKNKSQGVSSYGHEFSTLLFPAIAASKDQIDACFVMEMFRMELDAVVGYVTLSHRWMSLKPGEV